MFISWSKAQRINESLCLFVAGLDHCTADAEHLQQQWWHIYVVYVPPQAPCPWVGMLAMFRAMAAEVWLLLISSGDFRGFWSCTFASQAPPHHFPPRFCTILGWELSWGTKVVLRAFPQSAGNTLNYSLQGYYELVVLPHWISILDFQVHWKILELFTYLVFLVGMGWYFLGILPTNTKGKLGWYISVV